MKNIRRLLSLITCFYISQVGEVYASDREIALKAGLIFNFAVYSKGEWFDTVKHKNYLICSPDPSFVRVARQTLQNKKVRNSPVLVQYISLDTFRNHHCNAVFFSANRNIALKFDPLNNNFLAAMLIGESDGFIERGGHINFFLAGGRVRFEIDPVGLRNSNIEVSSKVIRLGKVVSRGADD
ncbi:MAG: YfiR family protein [Colwellia sp.]|nr:YfiR family protein [Colwellia sp.]